MRALCKVCSVPRFRLFALVLGDFTVEKARGCAEVLSSVPKHRSRRAPREASVLDELPRELLLGIQY